ncbi:MAG: PsiF family protein [Alphaproteobacteria bacterium]|nr:PsiF family protein [Alphaproteobacteria bacterium]
MKKVVLSAFAFALLLGAGQALAQTQDSEPARPQRKHSAQQNRMKDCAAQYHEKNIAKSEYRNFMAECLKKHPRDGRRGPPPMDGKMMPMDGQMMPMDGQMKPMDRPMNKQMNRQMNRQMDQKTAPETAPDPVPDESPQ